MFNLKAVLKGAPVLTLEGREAKFVCLLKDERIPARLVMMVDTMRVDDVGDGRFVLQNYYLDGKFIPPVDSEMDLQMADPLEYYDSEDLLVYDEDDDSDPASWPSYPIRNVWLTDQTGIAKVINQAKVSQPVAMVLNRADKTINQLKAVARK